MRLSTHPVEHGVVQSLFEALKNDALDRFIGCQGYGDLIMWSPSSGNRDAETQQNH